MGNRDILLVLGVEIARRFYVFHSTCIGQQIATKKAMSYEGNVVFLRHRQLLIDAMVKLRFHQRGKARRGESIVETAPVHFP